jgi:hypothetical protein
MSLAAIVLSTLVRHKPVTWSAISSPTFRSGPCQTYNAGPRPGGATVLAHVEENGRDVALAGVIWSFSLQHDGFLYYRLDNNPGQYLGQVPSNNGQSFGIWFLGLADGAHSIRYGLISRKSSNISYGEVCFNVQPGRLRQF